MNVLEIAFVASTIGVFLILVSPLGRLLGLYGPTRLVDSGWILGMYGRPTTRLWALFALQFGVAAAYNFSTGDPLFGVVWSLLAVANVWHAVHEHRRRPPSGGHS
jgi:hypothetical protein